MRAQQIFDGISNGDISCEHFMAFYMEAVHQAYTDGYLDCLKDDEGTRNFFLKEAQG